MPIVPILLAAFIGVPLAEIAVFIQVGQEIGVGWTLALIVLTALIGAAMLRQQGFAVLGRARRELDQDRVPVLEVFEGLCLLLAGALLLTPGFITDTAGGLLLLPPVRAWLYERVRHRIELRVMREVKMRGRREPPPRQPPTLDAEFEEIEPDEPGPTPPPRGGWGPRR